MLLLSTSGTTQNPKFVRLSNINLQSNTKSIIKYLKINSSHTTITTMPMGYSYGLSIISVGETLMFIIFKKKSDDDDLLQRKDEDELEEDDDDFSFDEDSDDLSDDSNENDDEPDVTNSGEPLDPEKEE